MRSQELDSSISAKRSIRDIWMESMRYTKPLEMEGSQSKSPTVKQITAK